MVLLRELAISGDGKILYAATHGGGVFRLAFTNYSPKIYSYYPDNTDTLIVDKGDTVRFTVLASDANNDSLQYYWFLDSEPLDSKANELLLDTKDKEIGLYSVKVNVSDGELSTSGEWILNIKEGAGIEVLPTDKKIDFISPNYPNPFKNVTLIEYSISKDRKVSIKVYDINGRLVRTLVDRFQKSGKYKLYWNSKKLATGIYFYRIKAGEFSRTKKMMIVK